MNRLMILRTILCAALLFCIPVGDDAVGQSDRPENEEAFAYFHFVSCLGTCVCMDSVPCEEALIEYPYTSPGQPQVNLYLFAIDEISEIRFGVEFSDNVQWLSYGECVPAYVWMGPTYPLSGTWVKFWWPECHTPPQPDGFLGLAYFRLNWTGGPGYFRIVPHDDVGGAVIVDCGSNEQQLAEKNLPIFGFGGTAGYNPCDTTVGVPAGEVSWGRIKSFY